MNRGKEERFQSFGASFKRFILKSKEVGSDDSNSTPCDPNASQEVGH